MDDLLAVVVIDEIGRRLSCVDTDRCIINKSEAAFDDSTITIRIYFKGDCRKIFVFVCRLTANISVRCCYGVSRWFFFDVSDPSAIDNVIDLILRYINSET